MAYLWARDKDRTWSAISLSDDPLEIGQSRPMKLRPEDHPLGREDGVVLFSAEDAYKERTWTLIWGAGRTVRINGYVIHTGLRTLTHGDEITVSTNEPVFFSNETVVRVEIFEGSDKEIFCPRCKKTIETGQSIIRCPECGIAYHTSDDPDKDCWHFGPACMCGHSTKNDNELLWVPDDTWC